MDSSVQKVSTLEIKVATEIDATEEKFRAFADENSVSFEEWSTDQSANLAVQEPRQRAPENAVVRGHSWGRQRSRHNALRHGILSQVVLLKGEPRAEFDSLLRGLRNYHKAEGTTEELLVDNLATIAWRKRRLLIAEGAEIRKRTEFLEWDKMPAEDEAVDVRDIKWFDHGLISKIANPQVLEHCLCMLEILNIGIELEGFDKKRGEEILQKLYGSWGLDPTLAIAFDKYLDDTNPSSSSTSGDESDVFLQRSCKARCLSFLKNEMTRLERYKTERPRIESKRVKVELLCRNVPDAPQLDRLLRYETFLEKSFERTLNQLDRLQRTRKGQPVPPTLNVNVSS